MMRKDVTSLSTQKSNFAERKLEKHEFSAIKTREAAKTNEKHLAIDAKT